ncbi:MAG: hypothetical protein GC154_07885 [bacterium]|nr:hypothetical protein [bacterium]
MNMTRLPVWIALGLFIAGLPAAHAASWLGGLFSEGDLKPKYNNIQFWDFDEERMRGIRALFYTLPQERENRLIDQRLHSVMTQYLSSMCSEVITLESFDNDQIKAQVENAVVGLVDQWKMKGEIDPAAFFAALPFIDVDAVVFLERTDYEQTWKKDKKLLLIGYNLAAFEMDLGRPLFKERFYDELPWFSEKTSYIKAEQKALLKGADQLGGRFVDVCNTINELHVREEAEKQAQARAAQQEARAAQQEEQRQLAAMLKEADRVLAVNDGPPEVLDKLRAQLAMLTPLLSVSNPTPETLARRNAAARDVESTLTQLLLMNGEPLPGGVPANAAAIRPAEATGVSPVMESRAAPAEANAATGAGMSAKIPASDLLPVDWRAGGGSVTDATPLQNRWTAAPSAPYPIGNPFDRRWLVPGAMANQPGSATAAQ